MSFHKDEHWLDEMITRAVGSEPVRFDPEQLKQKIQQTQQHGLRAHPTNTLRRFLMKSRITQIAATVLIAAGLIAIVGYFAAPGSSIAWADVAQKVQQATSFSFRQEMTMNGSMAEGMPPMKNMKMTMSYLFSNDYGMKMQTFTNGQLAQEMAINPATNTSLMIMPEQKTYQRIVFNEQFAQQMKKQMNDPRDMFKHLENCEYTDLGRDTIDGIEVEGIESTDPKMMGGMFEEVYTRIWVDTVNGWPVQVEMNITTNNGQMEMAIIQKDFQWNIDIDPAEFELEIPDDYTEMPAMNMPPMNEETAIAGLNKYLELVGRYPTKLNMMDMIQELIKIKKDQPLPENYDNQQEYQQDVMPIQFLGIFYMQLVQQDKDPQYYGETVTPDDHDAVLLRWKSADDKYTVIYGDLSSETVTAERMREMEQVQP